MKKLSMILTFLVIFGSSVIGHTSDENVVFEGTFERGNTIFERAIGSKGTGNNRNGTPVTQFGNFLGSSGEATLKVCNDAEAEKISSAKISINGNVVLSSSNFNQNVGCIQKTVNLNDGDNILEVLLKSKPGGKVSIVILQADSSQSCDVCDDNSDGYPNVVIATTTVGPGYGPYAGIAVSGEFAYVSNYSEGKVYVIKTSDNSLDTDITVGSAPIGISLNHDGTRAYVNNSGDGTVSVIDTNSNTLIDADPSTVEIDPITVGGCPFGISMLHGSDRDYAYVSDFCSSKVYVIDTLENNVIGSIDVRAYPFGISVSPKGGRAYVANFGDGTVSVIDTDNNEVIATIPVGIGPFGISVTPNGARAYVCNVAGETGTVSVIDTDSNTVIDTITVGNGPAGISVTPNGAYAYVNNSGDDTVSVIDTNSNTLIDTDPSTVEIDPITVGYLPYGGIAVSPDGKSVYVGNYKGNDDGDGTVSVIGF